MSQKLFSSGLIMEPNSFDTLESIHSNGSTSLTYRVTLKGKVFFLKQLRPEFNDDWRFRAAFHKEYEVGSKIQSKHVVKYIKMDENEKGVYLLMEHVNGFTINQKLSSYPE